VRGVMQGMLEGKRQADIAREMGVSPQGVNGMLKHAMDTVRAGLEARGIGREIIGGAAVLPKPDFGPQSFEEAQDAFDPEDPETWPIDMDRAAAMKEQTALHAGDGHVADPDALKSEGYPDSVVDAAKGLNKAIETHYAAKDAAIKAEGQQWKAFFDNPDRQTAYRYDEGDPETWPKEAAQAWDKVVLNDPSTYPAGLHEAAEKAGMIDHDDPDAEPEGDIDEDFAQEWTADHVARPEWLAAVHRLPDGDDILAQKRENDGTPDRDYSKALDDEDGTAHGAAVAEHEQQAVSRRMFGFQNAGKAIAEHLQANEAVKLVHEAHDDIVKWWAPQFRGEAAARTGRILSANLAEIARSRDHAEAALHAATAIKGG
jgi:hypothetical protein